MLHTVRLTQLMLAAALAATATGASALTGDPTGNWSGTIKCAGVSSGVPKFSSTANASMTIDGDRAAVYALVEPWILYGVAYVPDVGNPANRGTLGFFAADVPDVWQETGQAKIERARDGKVSLDGKSYVLFSLAGSIASGFCEWKLNKTSDTPSELP